MIVTHICKFDVGREIADTNKNISPLDKIDISFLGFHRMLFTFPLYFIFIKKNYIRKGIFYRYLYRTQQIF